ncbi:MAG TPA: hypothetical protein V6D04_02250 [Candidatus Obscuribacterales bacterium]
MVWVNRYSDRHLGSLWNQAFGGACPQTPAEGRLRPPGPLQKGSGHLALYSWG